MSLYFYIALEAFGLSLTQRRNENSHPKHPMRTVSDALIEKMRKANERLRRVQLAGPPRPTAHECFQKGLLVYGHLPGRKDMSPVHQLVLV